LESFELSPENHAVMSTPDKLLITYPGPALSIPAETAANKSFQENIASFLSSMDFEVLDSALTTVKAGSEAVEERDTADPHYIIQLLTGILRGYPGAAIVEPRRVTKRIAEEVLWKNAFKPWRRLPLWLLIRVTLQTTISEQSLYKTFLLFFMSKFALSCIQDEHAFSSEILYIMRAKVARRSAKLEDAIPEFVASAVDKAIANTQIILDRRWKKVQNAQEHSAPWNPRGINIETDTRLALTNSREYLDSILFPANSIAESTSSFKPSHPSRFDGDFHQLSDNRLLDALKSDNPLIVLYDFEQHVQNNLESWVSDRLDSQSSRLSACNTLLTCFEQYVEASKKHFDRDNPEDQSHMLLTVLEIWVAIDRLTTEEIPLLTQYSPEIPENFLEPLLAQKAKDIELANKIERYIRERHEDATNQLSIFSDVCSDAAFPVKYFHNSSELMNLKNKIEVHASTERRKTRTSLQKLNNKYKSLIDQASQKKCEYFTSWVGRLVHARNCVRCDLENEAAGLRINVHEWPLPSDPQKAMCVVFELACPQLFSIWRDVTYTILTELGCLSPPGSKASPFTDIEKYSSFENFRESRSSLIRYASESKPFVYSHYSSTRIPATEDQVCVNNGLRFRLFDSSNQVWADREFEGSTLADRCTLKLPRGSRYRHLQFAIDGTSHTSNSVLAKQSDCPKELSVNEHVVFGSLRSGGRLQWMNMARELRARSLMFRTPEVHYIFLQALSQLGPLYEGVNRDWHIDLENADFCKLIIHESGHLLRSIGQNWQEALTLRIIG
jgi:hypothetical protein